MNLLQDLKTLEATPPTAGIADGKSPLDKLKQLFMPFVGRDDMVRAIGFVANVGSPTTGSTNVLTPQFIGQVVLDTTNNVFYRAKGLTSADWVQETGLVVQNLFTADSNNASHTLAAAATAGAEDVTINMTGNLGGAANATLPTVAALLAAIPNFVPGMTYRLRIINSSAGAFAWTVVTNTGWTLAGTMTIAQNTWRDFYVTMTSASAATLQQIGTGTTS